MSHPAARRHLGYSMVEILICRKAVVGGHEITSLDTPGVLDVVNIQVSVVGRKINMSCTVHTEYGTADINYEFG